MKKEFYTKEEAILIEGAKALAAKQKVNEALALDLALLELEAEVGLMDGLPLPKEGCADGN